MESKLNIVFSQIEYNSLFSTDMLQKTILSLNMKYEE